MDRLADSSAGTYGSGRPTADRSRPDDDRGDLMQALSDVVGGARCWGIELDARYRVLAVTVEPDPFRSPLVMGEHQLLCFPVSVLLVTVTRPVVAEGVERTAVMTFEIDQLTEVSERFGGAVIPAAPFGRPEPRPATWGPVHSLQGRSSAPDGTRNTLTLDLSTEDGARLRLFARFDDAELRDASHGSVLATAAGGSGTMTGGLPRHPSAAPWPGHGERPEDEATDPLRF
jgi:hypothetical protein